jgi:hypothetical protein
LWPPAGSPTRMAACSRFWAIAAIPYAAGALGWGAYIAQDPGAFVSEYGYQIATRSQIPTGALDGSAG